MPISEAIFSVPMDSLDVIRPSAPVQTSWDTSPRFDGRHQSVRTTACTAVAPPGFAGNVHRPELTADSAGSQTRNVSHHRRLSARRLSWLRSIALRSLPRLRNLPGQVVVAVNEGNLAKDFGGLPARRWASALAVASGCAHAERESVVMSNSIGK